MLLKQENTLCESNIYLGLSGFKTRKPGETSVQTFKMSFNFRYYFRNRLFQANINKVFWRTWRFKSIKLRLEQTWWHEMSPSFFQTAGNELYWPCQVNKQDLSWSGLLFFLLIVQTLTTSLSVLQNAPIHFFES